MHGKGNESLGFTDRCTKYVLDLILQRPQIVEHLLLLLLCETVFDHEQDDMLHNFPEPEFHVSHPINELEVQQALLPRYS